MSKTTVRVKMCERPVPPDRGTGLPGPRQVLLPWTHTGRVLPDSVLDGIQGSSPTGLETYRPPGVKHDRVNNLWVLNESHR